ncbi:dehydrogenase [Pyrodictium occultum]|uniref:Dehydrogenase n=1 Tax=Pyrodictium occultum TaxID=2309 RepID=A0A0V8RWA6_PYROC|nr:digeranylgeranylglycerophospholipid reductase [Pyrodictium occultum]KSW12320.1 dehydrogenase [Pyrodictium occultum]
MQARYDAVIAGLGPAGSVALWHLARMGFRVAGFDMRDPSDVWGKPCGDAIGAHHPREAGLPEPPSHVVKNKVRAIDIYSPGETTRYRIYGEGYIIDRARFGKWLLDEASNKGAEVYFNARVLGPIISNGMVTGLRVKTENGVREVYANVVVEATGFSRAVRSRLPRDWPIYEDIDPKDTNIAYREIIEYEDYTIEEPDVIRIYIDQNIAPGGYWWYFPESSHGVNVGLGVQGGMGHPNPMTLYREKLLNHPLMRHRFRVVKSAGAPLPTRRPSNTLAGPGILVVGDAGYTVNPVHGGGMGYAFRAAYYAALAYEEAYNANDFSERGLWGINRRYMRDLGAKQAALDIFRRFLQRLSNDEIRFGMEKRLVPEQDVYYTSSSGELRIPVVEKAMIVLRGLRRPSLLAKLKTVADYMKRIRQLYTEYPEEPSGLPSWIKKVNMLIEEYEARISG